MNRKITKTIRAPRRAHSAAEIHSAQSMTNTRMDRCRCHARAAPAVRPSGGLRIAASPCPTSSRRAPAGDGAAPACRGGAFDFDYRLALAAVRTGFDKIRRQPSASIGSPERAAHDRGGRTCRERGSPHPRRREFRLGGKGPARKIRVCARNPLARALSVM